MGERGGSNPLMCYMCKFTVPVLEMNALPLFIKMEFFKGCLVNNAAKDAEHKEQEI